MRQTLPDGTSLELLDGATGADAAAAIGAGLARAALGVRLDGELLDLDRPLPHEGHLEIVTVRDEEDALWLIRHDCAHVLATAALELYPGVKISIGPPIEDGFYYDFDFPDGVSLSDADFERIEAGMRQHIDADEPFVRAEVGVDEALERFRAELGLDHVVLGVHDWGGLIGLRWACDHPGAARGLIVSCTGFFPDGKWHGLADAMRTPEQGEELIDSFDEEGFRNLLRGASPRMSDEALGEYWKAYSSPERRRGQLELYRSGDFEKLEPYSGQLTALGLPALILWGEHDPFAPVAGAYRFARELPGAQVVVVDAGHFVWEDEPERCAAEVREFLETLAP